MKTCFGYVRVSTQKQGEGVSLDAQREAIRVFASRQNLQVTEWFEEKETAAKSGRPIFTKMLKLLEHRKADGLIIHKIDRSARNLKDWAIISDLSDAGIDVYFATESLDFRSRGGRLTADIQAVIAADYIRNLSEEARKGINGRLKQGIYPWPAPLGYLNAGSGKPKPIDPIRAPLVRQLFSLYLTGNYSIRTLHTEMLRRGLTNTLGRRTSRHSVEHILSNPFYCGQMRNGRTGELFPGLHEPLISAHDFKRIQAIKAGRFGKKVTKHNHLFRRLIACANCTRPLTGELHKGRVYYRCHTQCCNNRSIREDGFASAVLVLLAQLEVRAKTKEDIKSEILAWDFRLSDDEALRSVVLRVSEAEARLSRLTDLLVNGAIEPDEHQKRRATIKIDLAALQEEQHDLELRRDDGSHRERFFELASSLTRLYESAMPDEKREIIDQATSNRTWDGENLVLEPQNWLDLVLPSHGVSIGGPTRATSRSDRVKLSIQITNFVKLLGAEILPQSKTQPKRNSLGQFEKRSDSCFDS